MKVKLVSDLHLEFGPISLDNNGADVLILSGDICVAHDLHDRSDPAILGMTNKSNQYHAFFQECCERFPHVIYVAGNHEHYHGDFAFTIPRIKEKLAYLPNLYILDKESKTIGDVTFIGGTLWTDMNKEDPMTLHHIKYAMNDFRCVDNSNAEVTYKVFVNKTKPVGMTDEEWLKTPSEDRTTVEFRTRPAQFSPADAVEDHKLMRQFIDSEINSGMTNQKFVVVGHHAPSKQSTKPRYRKDAVVNGAYSSDLSEYILDHPQIKLWTHGHTHDFFDYMIGTTRIVCNPRGYYGYEENMSFQPEILIEV